MGRLILIAVAIAVVVWLLRRALREPDASAGPRDGGAPADLVRCAHCGLHLPRGEARAAAGRLYCSDEHAARGPTDSA